MTTTPLGHANPTLGITILSAMLILFLFGLGYDWYQKHRKRNPPPKSFGSFKQEMSQPPDEDLFI